MSLRLRPLGGGVEGESGPPLRMRPLDIHGGHGGRRLCEYGRGGSRGNVVADVAVEGERAKACHERRGHVTSVEDVASRETAAKTTASDVAAHEAVGGGGGRRPSLRMRPWEDRRGCRLCRQEGRRECCIERMRLLDGCVVSTASDAMRHACKLLQGSFCRAVTWPRSLFASADSNLAQL